MSKIDWREPFSRQHLSSKKRTMLEFAEDEIVIKSGPRKGRFRSKTQPYSKLFFEEVVSGRWEEIVAFGPTQSGKSTHCYVIPIMYHLFEVGETVVCGIPKMDIAGDKWREDIKPAILASRYAHLVPDRGEGSREGTKITAIKFRNGSTLRFMSGGGDDKTRAGFTTRVVIITETDGFDKSSKGSAEADKITQIIGRTRAYENPVIYMECTLSTDQGTTWKRYKEGTESKIVRPCVHCGEWVTPEREHFKGWQKPSIKEAANCASWHCPACNEKISDDDRMAMNLKSKLIHRGQEIDKSGNITGSLPETNILGFRFSAFDNMLRPAKKLAEDEWKASQDDDEDNASKFINQFVYANPHVITMTTLKPGEIAGRMSETPKSVFCGDKVLTVGIDVGKFSCHWVAIGWYPDATGNVIDYGVFEVPSRSMGLENAVKNALESFYDRCTHGWESPGGPPVVPSAVWTDSRYCPESVHEACHRMADPRFAPTVSFGADQSESKMYYQPSTISPSVRWIGLNVHLVAPSHDTGRGWTFHVNSDFWKSWVHERFRVPIGLPGSMRLFYSADGREHLGYSHHIMAEQRQETFVPGRGLVAKYVKKHKHNHYLDATYLACCASYWCGVRVVGSNKAPAIPYEVSPIVQKITTEDGRPYYVRDR